MPTRHSRGQQPETNGQEADIGRNNSEMVDNDESSLRPKTEATETTSSEMASAATTATKPAETSLAKTPC